jgi:hypothetical protein
MNKKQLIDALGQLDDSVYEGTDLLNVLPGGNVSESGKSHWGRKIFLLAAATVLLIGGAAIAAPPLLRGGALKPEKETVDGKDYNRFRYETGEASCVPLSEITGSVLESMKEIPERVSKAPFFDSIMPNCIIRHFDTITEALSYIGYSKLAFPDMDYTYREIHTEALGVSAQHPKVNAPDEEYVLGSLYLSTTQYDSVSGLSFQNLIHIYTEANPFDSTSLLLVDYPTETSYVTEEQTVNGRVFSIIKKQNTSEDPGWQLSTEVLWQENGVIYMFHVTYSEDKAAEADRLVEEWMKSFP